MVQLLSLISDNCIWYVYICMYVYYLSLYITLHCAVAKNIIVQLLVLHIDI